jgi:hypothetical protein
LNAQQQRGVHHANVAQRGVALNPPQEKPAFRPAAPVPATSGRKPATADTVTSKAPVSVTAARQEAKSETAGRSNGSLKKGLTGWFANKKAEFKQGLDEFMRDPSVYKYNQSLTPEENLLAAAKLENDKYFGNY